MARDCVSYPGSVGATRPVGDEEIHTTGLSENSLIAEMGHEALMFVCIRRSAEDLTA